MALAMALLLLLQACSSTTFIYNRLDFILPWYLDDYVDLNRLQKASLDELLTPFLHWHRTAELPHYVEILAELERDLDTQVTPEMVGQRFSEVESAWLRIEEEAINWMLALGAELSDEQIAAFLAVLQEQQDEYEEDYLGRSEEAYLEDSYDNFVDGLQDYMGRLDKGQRASLREASAQLQRMDTLWLIERAVWLANLGAALEREPGWQRQLRAMKAAREESYSPAYREMYAHNMAVVEVVIAKVLNSRTQKQDRRLRSKIKDLREDLEALSAVADAR
jgi:hypothetical protein